MPEKRKMEYGTYLFDFDYTLADSSRGIVICFRNVLTRHGHTDVTDALPILKVSNAPSEKHLKTHSAS